MILDCTLYLATGRLQPDVAVQIVEGLASACRDNGCALLGGETAEMPGFYADGEYDVAGFIVGVVDAAGVIDGRDHCAGRRADRPALVRPAHQRLLARAPDCVRARRVCDSTRMCAGARRRRSARRCSRRIGRYLPLDAAAARRLARSRAWRTSPAAGITDNLPRILPAGYRRRRSTAARGTCRRSSSGSSAPGSVPDDDMLRTFNMGIGLIVVCAPEHADRVVADLARCRRAARQADRHASSGRPRGVRIPMAYASSDVVAPARSPVGVLISGRGSNLQALIDASRPARSTRASPSSSRTGPMRPGSTRARSAGIETLVLDHRALRVPRRLTTRGSRSAPRARRRRSSASPASCAWSARRCSTRFRTRS